MSVIPQVSGQLGASRIYERAPSGVDSPPKAAASNHWTDPAAVSEVRLTRGDLLQMNGAGGADAGTRNALATAHDALGVIGGLLANVGAVLGAAASGDPSFDLKTDQARVDGAVATIDTVVTSATFGGKKLLDGSYSARMPAGTVEIPRFVSTELGTDAGEGALQSLAGGGANELASGRTDAAGKIVAAALRRVNRTQSAIEGATRGNNTVELPATDAADWVKSAAREMLHDPGLAVVAVANSDPRNVLGLIGG